jgi:spoIIIJ-associated protein
MAESTREFEGDDLEDALRSAAEALGSPADALDFEVLEDGRRGVFGLGARQARIAVRVPEPPSRPAPASIETRSPAPPHAALEALRRILALMGLELTAEADDALAERIKLEGPDRAALTRNGGELLTSLQTVLNRMGRRGWPDAGHVELVCEGWRDEDSVADLAREVAEAVSRTGEARKLPPMNPFERRIVHVTVGEFPGLATRSEGDGFLKRVVVETAVRGRSPRLER